MKKLKNRKNFINNYLTNLQKKFQMEEVGIEHGTGLIFNDYNHNQTGSFLSHIVWVKSNGHASSCNDVFISTWKKTFTKIKILKH